jgi:peptide/nickel transport system permease protein
MGTADVVVSLGRKSQAARVNDIPLGRSIAIVLLIALLGRFLLIAIVSLLDLIGTENPPMSLIASPFNALDNLSFILTIPIGILFLLWAQRTEAASIALDTMKNLFRNRSAVIGMSMIVALVGIGDFAPFIATHDPILSMIGLAGETGRLPGKPPCVPVLGCTDTLHIMGLDLNARDMFSRVVYGAQTSIRVGIASVSISILIGTILGLISGFFGGGIDNFIMRIMDVLLAFPSLLLAITIVTIRGPNLQNALLAIGIVSIPVYARLIRASVLSVKELEFVTASRALGAPSLRILFSQVFPNSITPLIVQGTLSIGTAVLEAAALSFLGLGVQPPTPEWGQMLSEARAYALTTPHLVFFPGIAIMFTVLGFNLLGDGLRDALDPRLNRR